MRLGRCAVAEQGRTSDPAALAKAEHRAGSRLAAGPVRWVLVGCALLYLAGVVLPFAGSAAGWQILGFTQAAHDAHATIAEYVFTWASLIGLGVITPAAMLTRRYGLAALGWVITAISLVNALLSIWLRRSSAEAVAGTAIEHGPGMYVCIAAVLIAVFAYIPAILRRSDDQLELARQRARARGDDPVAQLQHAATQRVHEQQSNPLLIDDRRRRAAEKRQLGGDSN
ncbi:Uncharacterised protein [Chlamydia trachomatis]|nr:Uncharacterised protein [Chlamydia trachomatis]